MHRSSLHLGSPRLSQSCGSSQSARVQEFVPIFFKRFQSSSRNRIPLFLNVHWCTYSNGKSLATWIVTHLRLLPSGQGVSYQVRYQVNPSSSCQETPASQNGFQQPLMLHRQNSVAIREILDIVSTFKRSLGKDMRTGEFSRVSGQHFVN